MIEATCCEDSEHCCPADAPVCDLQAMTCRSDVDPNYTFPLQVKQLASKRTFSRSDMLMLGGGTMAGDD